MRRYPVDTNADAAAMRRSQAIAIASPAPTAGPGSAAMVGLRTDARAPVSSRCRSCSSATFSSWAMASLAGSRWAPMPLTLPPAQNADPPPRDQQHVHVGILAAVLDHAAQRGRQLVRQRVAH